MNYQTELFHSLLNSFLNEDAALMLTDGTVLAVRGDSPAIYGTLAAAATTVSKYLKLKENDVAILNDPYSGGTTLNEMTFVMAVSEDILWMRKVPLTESFAFAKSIEEEGLRIPPTPILMNGHINEMILGAMGAHPLCPAHLVDWVKDEITKMQRAAKRLHESIEFSGLQVTPEIISDYISASRSAAVHKISDSASGETRIDIQLDSGELLRVSMEIHDGKINLDFSGTTAGKMTFLTESAVYGICFHTISQFYKFTHLANSGSFSTLQIVSPAVCWLNAKYPSPAYRGITVGAVALKNAIELALSQIHGKTSVSINCGVSTQIQLESNAHSSALKFGIGTGASNQQSGGAATSSSTSIEQIEKGFPILVTEVKFKDVSEDTFKQAGGRGVEFGVKATSDIQLRWMTDLTTHSPRLPKSFVRKTITQFKVVDGNESEQLLQAQGDTVLKKNSIFKLATECGVCFDKQSTT